MLPARHCSLLERTDLTSERAWQQVSAEAQAECEEGFRAYIEPVSNRTFEGATLEAVKAAVPASANGAAVLFIADTTAMTLPDHPILVVDLLKDNGGPPFRCIPAELWAVDNNLNIANMGWDDFATALDEDGVYRGLRADCGKSGCSEGAGSQRACFSAARYGGVRNPV